MPDITEPLPFGLGVGPATPASITAVFSHGSTARLWFSGFPVSAYLTKVGMSLSIEKWESTPFGNTASTFAPGLEASEVSLEGFYDTVPLDPDSTLERHFFETRRETLPVSYFPGYTSTVGDPAYIMNGRAKSYSVDSPVDDVTSFEVDMVVSAPLSRGIVLKPDTLEVTSGVSDTYDTGATRQGVMSLLSVSTVSGVTPELSVTLQHSSDGVSWSDLASFSPAHSVSADYISAPNLVAQRFLRTSWTLTGTSPSFTFNVALALSGNFS